MNKDPTEWDYEYIDYYKKALENTRDPNERSQDLDRIKYHEAFRDYFAPSLRHINHLVQIDEKPNLELKEPQCQIYKISSSFQPILSKYVTIILLTLKPLSVNFWDHHPASIMGEKP